MSRSLYSQSLNTIVFIQLSLNLVIVFSTFPQTSSSLLIHSSLENGSSIFQICHFWNSFFISIALYTFILFHSVFALSHLWCQSSIFEPSTNTFLSEKSRLSLDLFSYPFISIFSVGLYLLGFLSHRFIYTTPSLSLA